MDKKIWRRMKWIVPFFVVFFLFSSLLQYVFVKSRVDKGVSEELGYSASQINQAINLVGIFNFQGIDRARIEAKDYYVFYEDGLLLNANAERSISGLIKKIEFLGFNELSDMQPKTLTSSTGEKWRMLLKKVENGTVILGLSSIDQIKLPDKKLLDNAKYFGSTLKDARRVNLGFIDIEVDYAVIDGQGNLVSTAGRIPLYANKQSLRNMAEKKIQEMSSDGRSYLVLCKPLLDSFHKPTGTIIVTQDITLEKRALNNQVLFNVLFTLFSVIGLLSFGLMYAFMKKSAKR